MNCLKWITQHITHRPSYELVDVTITDEKNCYDAEINVKCSGSYRSDAGSLVYFNEQDNCGLGL